MKNHPKQKVILAGYSTELILLCEQNGYTVMGIVEPKRTLPKLPYPVFVNDEDALNALAPDFVISGIDLIERRVKVDKFYTNKGISPANLICGEICSSSRYGDGLITQRLSLVSSNCSIGRCVKINSGAIITHDVDIGDYSTIAPGAVVLGRVSIADEVYIGANSTILTDLQIGKGATIGAGAVVTKDVAPYTTVKGIPAR